jgi:hypothetical protein
MADSSNRCMGCVTLSNFLTFADMRLRVAVVAPLVWLSSFAAQAQDDLLAPLAPDQPKPKPKPKTPKRPPPHAKKPPTKPPEEDLLSPLVSKKTELWVKLTSPSQDATLYIDGVASGPVPANAFEITAGDHVLVIKRPGFADFSERVKASDGQVTEVSATLVAVSGILAVTSDQVASEVVVDGNPEGTAPIHDVNLTPGTHLVTVRHEGYQDDVSRIVVKAGKQYTVSAHLKPGAAAVAVAARSDRPEETRLAPTAVPTQVPLVEEESPPVYKRWYVWAGAAAVVAAAVVASVAVVRSNSYGPPSPSTVCQGACAGVINSP